MRHYASVEYAVVMCLSVCLSPSVLLSVTQIMLTSMYNGPGTLIFWCQRSWWNYNRVTPNGCAKYYI